MRSIGWLLVSSAAVLGVLAYIVTGDDNVSLAAIVIPLLVGGVMLIQTKKLVLESDEKLSWGPEAAHLNWSILNSKDHYKVAVTDKQLLFGRYFGGETDQRVIPLGDIASVSRLGWLTAGIVHGSETEQFRFGRPSIRNPFVDVLVAEGIREVATHH